MMKRCISMLLATVLVFNTFLGSFDTISYAEEKQDVCSSDISETNEIEESMEKVNQEVSSNISTEEIAEEKSEEFSVVDIEMSTTEFQESTDGTEQYTSDEQTTESMEEQSTEKETEENTQSIETEISESVESTSELSTVSETESISETEAFNNENVTIQLDIDIVELYVGEEKQINAVWKSGDIVTEGISWTSSDNTVAKVEKGKITAVGVGEATITATLASESIKDSCQVRVLEKDIEFLDSGNNDFDIFYDELDKEKADKCSQIILRYIKEIESTRGNLVYENIKKFNQLDEKAVQNINLHYLDFDAFLDSFGLTLEGIAVEVIAINIISENDCIKIKCIEKWDVSCTDYIENYNDVYYFITDFKIDKQSMILNEIDYMKVEEEGDENTLTQLIGVQLFNGGSYEKLPPLTGNKRQDVINVALSQDGYLEGGSNYNAYAQWLIDNGYGARQNEAWCGYFATWCAYIAGVDKVDGWPSSRSYGSCCLSLNWFKTKEKWHRKYGEPWYASSRGVGDSGPVDNTYEPQAGDFVAINTDGKYSTGPNHVGIYLYKDSKYYYIMEGNTSVSGGGEGVAVALKRYYISTNRRDGGSKIIIFGFGEANYGEPTQPINKTPIGYLDEIKVSDDSVTIRGWARDDNDSNRAVEIIMEVGGNTYTTTANQYRPDVGSHGYEATFKVNCYGAQTVNVYAMDSDINQKFLLQNGNRNVTIQRPFKIEYELSQVELAYGDSRRISFAFQADGVAQFDIATGDGRIAQARFDSIDWNKGVGYVNITSDCAVGRTDLTISFLDSNRNKIYRKSIPITVTGQFDIKFSPVFNYVRETEECLVNFKVTGNGASSIFYDISDTSIAADMGWHNGGYNHETGEGCIAVRGIKEGMTNLTVKLWNVNGDIICERACVIRVMEGADIFFSDKRMKVDRGSSKSQKATYKGYGVTDVTVEAITPDIAEASIINNDKSKKEVEIVVTGHKTGTASFLFYLWDATGKQAGYRSLRVRIEEPFDILLDDNSLYMWKGDARAIYFLINGSYAGAFNVSYEIEDGDNVVEITGSDGDENDGRRVFLKALDSGMATLYIRIWGTGTEKDTLLYETSIFIMVFGLNVSPRNKTAYVGETFQIESVCDPAVPTDLKLSYTSSDDTVASVSSNGLVTAKKTGKTTITVTGTTSKKQYSVPLQLTVVEKKVNVTGISVFPANKEMTTGDMFTLDVSFSPSNATNTNVTYSSNNTSVAAVNQFGRITATGVGETKVTVTSNDGGKKASCNIVVKPAVVASGKTGDLDWKITDEKGDYTLTISGNGAMADYSGPETKNEPEWYQYNEKLKHLVLEEGITRIGRSAFSCCESLGGELKLPSSIKVIGQEAFYDCIGFSGTLHLPDNLECIEAGAFNRCSGFTGDIVIPGGIEDIRADVFAGCSGFNGSLCIPANVKTIRAGAFSQCTRLSGTLKLPDGLTSIDLDAFHGCNQLSGNLILPKSLKKIGGSAFNGCSGFTGNLILPESLTEIGSYAFSDCSGFIGDIMIPDGISRISEGIFYNCTGLNGALKLPRDTDRIGNCAFTNTRFRGMVLIPKSVTVINDKAFYGIPDLKVYFEGDAPEYIKSQNSYWASFSSDVQIYYNPDMSGWSTPKWNGYTAEPVSADTPFDIPVEGIGLGVSGEYLSLGDSIVLDYWLVPENTTERDVIWESSDTSVITVDENGRVKAVGYGEAVITVTTKNAKYSQRCEVLVMEQPDPTLYIEFDNVTPWMWVGETKTLNLRCGGRGFVGVGQAVYDPTIAEFVDWGETKYTTEGSGVHTQRHETRSMDIMGTASGKTNVAVRLYDGRANLIYQDCMELTVVDLLLSEYYMEIKEGDTSDKLQVSAYPEIGMPLQVAYKSSDETVVKVDEKGKLAALKSGTAIITVTSLDGRVSKKCDVVVYKEGAVDKEATQLAVPSASIENGSCVEKGTKLVLTCMEPEVDIYYTLDGSEPNKMSSIYTQPIEIVDDITIKAFAVKEGYEDSEIITLAYTVTNTGSDLEDKDFGDVLPEDIPANGKITDGLWIAGVKTYTYTGKPIKPEVRVYDSNRLLKAGQDYTIKYKNNTKANDASNESTAPAVVVKGKGNYMGIEKQTFKILPVDFNDASITADDITVAYNKKVQKKVPIVTFNGKKLTNKKDFTAFYPNQGTDAYKSSGTYEILLTARQGGNFTGTRTVRLTITNSTVISAATVRKIADQTYTGKAIEPELEVIMKKIPLVKNTDYTVKYANNIESGTATAILTGIGKYAGTKKVTFKIRGTSLQGAAVSGITDKVYTGTAQEQKISVTLNNKTLKPDTDYKVVYSKNVNAGTATVTINGINAYNGIIKKTFRINAYDINANAGRSFGGLEKEITAKYLKGGSRPNLELTFAGRKLVEGTDYTISYQNNKTVTTADAKNKPFISIKGRGNFKGNVIKTFTIIGKSLNDAESPVTLTVADKGFVNKAGKYISVPVLTDADGKKLAAGKDYEKTVIYTLEDGTELTKNSMVPIGAKIKVRVTGKGAYSGQLEGVYEIKQNDFGKAKISIKSQTYTGKAIALDKDSVTVRIGTETLTYGTDYEIAENSYVNNVKKGTASVTIVGKGNYGGAKTVKFRITARKFSWFWRLFG